MTWAEFLLARIAEDEELARTVLAINNYDREGASVAFDGDVWMVSGMDNPIPGGEVSGIRLMAECEAKRQIVMWVTSAQRYAAEGQPGAFDPEDAQALTHALQLLALPYADHPDYPLK